MAPALGVVLAVGVLVRPRPRRVRRRLAGDAVRLGAARRSRPVGTDLLVPERWHGLVVAATRVGLLPERSARVDAALPPVLDAVAGALRAGAAMGQALAAGAVVARGPLRDDLTRVVGAASAGVPLQDALVAWRVADPSTGVALVVAALCLAGETGGAGAVAVEAVAASIRDRHAALGEARSLATTARLSAGVLAVVPIAFAGLLALGDPGALGFLVGSPAGLSCLVGGLVLDGLGAVWMRRVSGAVR